MRAYLLLALGVSVAVAPLLGCDDSPEDTDTTTSSSGTGGSGTGGSASGTGGSASGTGGSASGTGGSASGTGGSTSGTAGGGGTPDFWDGAPAYDANGTPNPSDGEHNNGNDCMSCHASGGNQWLFGGTVHQSGGSQGAAHVQVGALVDGTLYTTYSANNGNFWLDHPGGSPSWAGAEVRFRNANGETSMIMAATAACNSCHSGNSALVEP